MPFESEFELSPLTKSEAFVKASKALESRFDLARTVIRARVRKGWTQERLAREAETKQSRVSEIESAKGNPTLETIERILGVLDLKVTFGPANSRPYFVMAGERKGEKGISPIAKNERRVGRLVQAVSHRTEMPAGTFGHSRPVPHRTQGTKGTRLA